MKASAPSAVVVGAGLAGLVAAYRLKQASWSVSVLERSDYPGGRAASSRKNGYLIDTGATGVGDVYTEYVGLIKELDLECMIEYSSPITATLRDGRLHEMNGNRPLLSGLRSRLLSLRSKFTLLRLFRDLRAMGEKMNFQDLSQGHEYDDESAEDYAHRRLNQELLNYLVDPILRALVVARASQVSRLELMNAMNGLFSTRLFGTRGGMELLPRTLAERIGEVRLGVEVSSVRATTTGVDVQGTSAEDGSSLHLSADACVLATTLPEACALYPACEKDVLPLAKKLHYVPGVCVHLGYCAKTESEAVMVLVSTRENPRLTLIWLDHNKVSDRAPEGGSLLYLYYDDAVADEAAQRRDEELVRECSTFVESVFPELAGTQDMSHVSRWPRAVPLPAPGLYRSMYKVRQNLDRRSSARVQLAGDYLSCVGQNTAIVYGEKAARHLIDNVHQLESAP